MDGHRNRTTATRGRQRRGAVAMLLDGRKMHLRARSAVVAVFVSGLLAGVISPVEARAPECGLRANTVHDDGSRVNGAVQARDTVANGRLSMDLPESSGLLRVDPHRLECAVSEAGADVRLTGEGHFERSGPIGFLLLIEAGPQRDDGIWEATASFRGTDTKGRVVLEHSFDILLKGRGVSPDGDEPIWQFHSGN